MGIMDSFEIGREGVSVHGKRLEIAAKNIAKAKARAVFHVRFISYLLG